MHINSETTTLQLLVNLIFSEEKNILNLNNLTETSAYPLSYLINFYFPLKYIPLYLFNIRSKN